MSLSQQMEQFFQEIGKKVEGYEEFEKEGWSFKVGCASSGCKPQLKQRL